MATNDVERSKFLSFVLRHDPGAHNLDMDDQGWVSVDQLITNAPSDLGLDVGVIRRIVAESPKQRFALTSDERWVRANQGHSVPVDVELAPTEPPDVLYHGTAEASLASIFAEGLTSQSRLHVHLSGDLETAIAVGRRHGKPVVLEVAARQMHDDGHAFFLSKNEVWLTEHVPAAYLRQMG